MLDLHQTSFWISIVSIGFNPLWWNIVARWEYKSSILTRYWGCGNPYKGCYVLAAAIFTLGLVRDYLFKVAIDQQPSLSDEEWKDAMISMLTWLSPKLFNEQDGTLGYLRSSSILFNLYHLVVYGLMGAGNILVLSSMYKLGITGTYLGDYFGILMDAPVTSFPFNVMANPMYTGSTWVFLGTALWKKSPAGIVLTAWVYLVYQVALGFEGPFTSFIYQQRSKKEVTKRKKTPTGKDETISTPKKTTQPTMKSTAETQEVPLTPRRSARRRNVAQ